MSDAYANGIAAAWTNAGAWLANEFPISVSNQTVPDDNSTGASKDVDICSTSADHYPDGSFSYGTKNWLTPPTALVNVVGLPGQVMDASTVSCALTFDSFLLNGQLSGNQKCQILVPPAPPNFSPIPPSYTSAAASCTVISTINKGKMTFTLLIADTTFTVASVVITTQSGGPSNPSTVLTNYSGPSHTSASSLTSCISQLPNPFNSSALATFLMSVVSKYITSQVTG